MEELLNRIKNIAPDMTKTFLRFPLPILFLAISTILFIGITNDIIPDKEDFWPLMALGFLSAAIFATAGRLLSESREKNIVSIIIFEIIIPISVIAAMQIKSFSWFFPFLLPAIGVFWLSISAFTKIGRGIEREEIQDRFWIMNHRAVISAIIAFVGFIIIALALAAIERSLSLLFALNISDIFYRYLLPFSGLFLAPVFWLSTIPKAGEISAKELRKPDFLSKAIGFLGQFLFVPFLFIYALILLIYGVQIAFTKNLPVGTLGWMVLGFTIIGAIAWLLVYPNFMRQKKLVQTFRAIWFYLTIIPLILFAIAVYIRIDAYGLTSLRMLLIAGGLWAILLSIFFLSKKFADIRLMPLLAGALLLFLSVGSWNLINAPLLDQSARLAAAINSAIPKGATFNNIIWDEESAKKAKGALDYLYEENGKKYIEQIFKQNKIVYNPVYNKRELYKSLKINEFISENMKKNERDLALSKNIYPNVAATPYFLGNIFILRQSAPIPIANIKIKISKQNLSISQNGKEKINVDLSEWIESQENDRIINPEFDFEIGNIKYRLLISNLALEKSDNGEWEIQVLTALLFSSHSPLASQ